MSILSKRYKRALVTGGSSGLGHAFTQMLLSEGIEVWATSRNIKKLPQQPNIHLIELDLLNKDSLNSLLNRIQNKELTFDLVINNAGAGSFFPFESFSMDQIKDQIQLLYTAPTLLTQVCYQQMLEAKHGTIVNVTSLAAQFPIPFMSLYNSSKSAFSTFTESLMMENQAQGIRIIDLQPGDFLTDFNDAANRPESFQNLYAQSAWDVLEKHRYEGPSANEAAKALKHILLKNKSGAFPIGDCFQAFWGPLFAKLAPKRLVHWFLSRYYKCPS